MVVPLTSAVNLAKERSLASRSLGLAAKERLCAIATEISPVAKTLGLREICIIILRSPAQSAEQIALAVGLSH